MLLPLMSAQCFRPTVAEFQRLITERSVPAPMSAAIVAADGELSIESPLSSMPEWKV